MPYVMVDVEADGPIPEDYSMVSFGVVMTQQFLRGGHNNRRAAAKRLE